MKTTMKQLTAGTIVALLLLVGNVNAEGTEAKAKAAVREISETTLQVEKWMTDEVLWNKKSISISEINLQTEASLELEDWMTRTETWNTSYKFVEESEADMEIECWMTCEKIWNIINKTEETETEIELTFENWMTNDKVWNR